MSGAVSNIISSSPTVVCMQYERAEERGVSEKGETDRQRQRERDRDRERETILFAEGTENQQ